MIEINEFTEEYIEGYIFPLGERSSIDCKFTVSDSSTIILKTGLSYIFALSKNKEKDTSKSYSIANESATKSLDILSVKGLLNSNIKSPTSHYIRWTKEESSVTLEITVQLQQSFSMRSGSYPVFSHSNYNDCFRFYRLAQISSDIFDSYRNLWLCFEWLLNDKYPIKNDEDEGETEWIKRAFSDFTKLANDAELTRLLKEIDSNRLVDTLYYETRLPLFHTKTKSNKKYLLPNKLEDMEKVRKSLTMLTIVVNSMISHYFNNRPHYGWVNPTVLIEPTRELFDDLRLYISNIKTDSILDEQTSKEQFNNLNFAPCTHSVRKYSGYVDHKFRAKIDRIDSNQTIVSRFSQVDKNNKEILAFTLDDALSLKGVRAIKLIATLEMLHIERAKTYNYRI